ncbi:hypothetical protein SADUNF_Sadunf11G0022000 [Salix dunnii]|uniref:NB-ARC domain-containing protein n=1 Tax=Salix dunnii TaxID=1413687 RepID=A0A835JJW2_9ROSI|nr:hypothetical protein SADUNF_Sadunf11G0022000 [Salix dunnii]
MDDEVGRYLLNKFRGGLQSSKVSWKRDLQELEKLIRQKIENSPAEERSSLREKLYRLNNILVECQTASFLSLEGIISLWRIRNTLKEIKEELKSKDPKGNLSPQKDGQGSSSNVRATGRLSHQSVSPLVVHGFDDEIMSLVKLLVYERSKEKFSAVGITGMAGSGKTTLCQEIIKIEEVKKHFVPRILVSMSKKPDGNKDAKIALVERILLSLGVEENIIQSVSNLGLSSLICALHVQLMGKKYMIVLDDAQEVDGWLENLYSPLPGKVEWEKSLAYGLPKGYGGTVIVTSRNRDLAKKMVGEENVHPVLPLTDKEKCWLIFRDAVEQDGTPFNPPNVDLEDLKMEIIRKCSGLPLAARMLGEIIKERMEEAPVPNGHDVTVQPQLPADCNSDV